MNLVELDRALRQLRLGGMAAVLESRLMQAQTEQMAPIDLISVLVSDELRRRADRLLERRTKDADFRESDRTLDTFDFDFNKKMNRRTVYELAAGHFIAKHEDALFLGPPWNWKEPPGPSHRPLRDPTGTPRALPRGTRADRGDRGCNARRESKRGRGRVGVSPAPDHRRPRDAKAPRHRGRGPPGAGHAALRARQHPLHLKPARR